MDSYFLGLALSEINPELKAAVKRVPLALRIILKVYYWEIRQLKLYMGAGSQHKSKQRKYHHLSMRILIKFRRFKSTHRPVLNYYHHTRAGSILGFHLHKFIRIR